MESMWSLCGFYVESWSPHGVYGGGVAFVIRSFGCGGGVLGVVGYWWFLGEVDILWSLGKVDIVEIVRGVGKRGSCSTFRRHLVQSEWELVILSKIEVPT